MITVAENPILKQIDRQNKKSKRGTKAGLPRPLLVKQGLKTGRREETNRVTPKQLIHIKLAVKCNLAVPVVIIINLVVVVIETQRYWGSLSKIRRRNRMDGTERTLRGEVPGVPGARADKNNGPGVRVGRRNSEPNSMLSPKKKPLATTYGSTTPHRTTLTLL